MTARCLICGRFYRECGPEETACPSHVYDWNGLSERERQYLVSQRIYAALLTRAGRAAQGE